MLFHTLKVIQVPHKSWKYLLLQQRKTLWWRVKRFSKTLQPEPSGHDLYLTISTFILFYTMSFVGLQLWICSNRVGVNYLPKPKNFIIH